jgi:hypothetical protein
MDYGNLIEHAWRLAWRRRFLWLLGLFVPGAGSSCNFNGSERLFEQVPPTEESYWVTYNVRLWFIQLGRWADANPQWVVGAAVGAAALLLLFLIVWVIAQGGMARATTALARGEPVTAGEAWRAGLRLFWRYAGLMLLQFLISLAALALAALPVGALIQATTASDSPRLLLATLLIVLGLLLVIALALFLISLSVVVAFAQRAVVVDGVGPIAALHTGLALARGRLIESAVIWVINLAVHIGIALATAVVVPALALPLGALGVWLLVALGVSETSIAVTILAFVVLLALTWFLGAVANAYSWMYWSLAYLELTGRQSVAMAVPAPG